MQQHTFDVAQAQAVATATIRSHWRLVQQIPHISADDLITDAVSLLWEHRASYDSARSSYSTWAGTLVYRRILLDRHRRSQCYARHVGTFGEVMGSVPDGEGDEGGGGVCNQNIPAKLFPRSNHQRHAPVALLAALQHRARHGIGWRTLHRQIAGDADLRITLGFDEPPALDTLRRAIPRFRRWAQKQRYEHRN